MTDEFKYRAFISYSHADEVWAKWLHRRLESYRVPSRLVGRQTAKGIVPRRIGRCFRDQVELSAASRLGETLQQALRDSQALIIVCSPRSATSHWVNEEIKYFRGLGRGDHIYALIVDGEPNAKEPSQECFPPALLRTDDGQLLHEPLAADARAAHDGKIDGFLKLTSGLLGVGFDELRQREQRRRTRLMAAVVGVSLGIAAMTTALAINAYHARNEATLRRQQADDLINFMLGDLTDRLTEVGRLDILDSTVTKVVSYLDSFDKQSLNPQALTQRSQVLVHIADIRSSRGKLPEANSAANEAIAIARKLQHEQPGDQSDELLAKALVILSALSVQEADFEKATPLTQETFEIASRLLAASPGQPDRVQLQADADENLAYIYAVGPKPDIDRTDALLKNCIDILRPLAQRAETSPKHLQTQMHCEMQRGVDLYIANRFDKSQIVFTDFLRDAQVAQERYPKSHDLLNTLLTGLGNATTFFSNTGQLDQAEIASVEALDIGRRLVSFEPDNYEWLQSLATATTAAVSLKIERKDWEAAQKTSDEALALFGKALAHSSEDAFLRRDVIFVHLLRASIFAHESQPDQSLAEVAAGLSFVRSNDSQNVLTEALRLRLRQWLYARGRDPNLVHTAQTAAHEILDHLAATLDLHQLEVPRAELAYLEGNLDDGNRIYETLVESHDPNASSIEEFRASACAERKRKSGSQCAAVEPKP
jgi:tetratricopeptide (TPR) repeat protein